MPANYDPSVFLRGGNEGDPARAQLAVRRLRAMVPGLTAFAQALTRNPRIRVIVSPGNPCTDGTNIYLRPPGELGDTAPHVAHLCGRRDENDTPLCPLCRTIEGVETTLYHEIAHIAYDSFEAVSDVDKAEIVKRRLAELGTDETTRMGKLAKQLADVNPSSYLAASGMVSEFLPLILNAMEDARVNLAMYRARPGTYKMFRGQVVHVLEEGIMQPDGTLVFWKDMPRNLQTVCALYATAAGFEIDGWFSDEVVAAMRDPELAAVLKRVQTARSAKAIYRLGFTVLEHLRRLGFCKRKDEAEDDQQEQEQEEVGSKDGSKGQRQNNEDAAPSEPQTAGMPEDDSPSQEQQTQAGPNPDGEDGDGQASDDPDGGTGAGDSDSDAEDDIAGASAANDDSDDEDGDEGGTASDEELAGTGNPDPSDDDENGSGVDDAGESDESVDDEDGDFDSDDGDFDSDDDDFDSDEEGSDSDDDDFDSDEEGSGSADSDFDPAERGEQLDCIECGQSFPKGSDKGQTYNHEHGGPLCNECANDEHEDDDDSVGGYDSGSSITDPGEAAPKQESGDYETQDTGDPYYGDGSPDEVKNALAQFGGHAEKLPTIEEMGDSAAIDKAIIQGEVFDSPSRNVLGVNVHREGQPVKSRSGYDISERMAWSKRYDVNAHTHEQNPSWPCRPCLDPFAYEIVPDEGVLAASLGRLRVVFSDNQKARQVRNLKRGRINAKVLGRRVPVADERLFQKKHEPGKKDYFVLLAMDNSGSTASGANAAPLGVIKRATFHQAELLARMGVKFAVYAQNGSPSTYDGSFYAPGSLMNLDIVVVKEAHEPWGPVQKARLMAVGPGGFNLDGHAMEYYRKVLDAQRQTDRVILYYTDGEMPNENYDEELDVLQREIKNCERRGYSVVGIGVGTDSPRRHGLDTIEINEVEDVPLVVKALESRINQKVGAA